jgi:hypothetical protein
VSRDALQGRARPVNAERSVRLLACDFFLVADCEEILSALDGMVQHASQQYPVSRRHRFEASWAGDGYRLREDGRELDSRGDARSAAHLLNVRMHELAIEALPEFTKIHAGCADWRGKRLVAVGPGRSGKTTLMTRLLYEGFAVHCDDIVLLRRGDVLPYPRRFRIRTHALALLPQIAQLAAGMPEGEEHLALDPSELGFEWRIDPAPADAVLFLEPNHGGATELEVCSKVAMAERIMSQSTPPAGGGRDWVRDICKMLEDAACYVLRCGDLSTGAAAVRVALGPRQP